MSCVMFTGNIKPQLGAEVGVASRYTRLKQDREMSCVLFTGNIKPQLGVGEECSITLHKAEGRPRSVVCNVYRQH